jgi:hypothetical protein
MTAPADYLSRLCRSGELARPDDRPITGASSLRCPAWQQQPLPPPSNSPRLALCLAALASTIQSLPLPLPCIHTLDKQSQTHTCMHRHVTLPPFLPPASPLPLSPSLPLSLSYIKHLYIKHLPLISDISRSPSHARQYIKHGMFDNLTGILIARNYRSPSQARQYIKHGMWGIRILRGHSRWSRLQLGQ